MEEEGASQGRVVQAMADNSLALRTRQPTRREPTTLRPAPPQDAPHSNSTCGRDEEEGTSGRTIILVALVGVSLRDLWLLLSLCLSLYWSVTITHHTCMYNDWSTVCRLTNIGETNLLSCLLLSSGGGKEGGVYLFVSRVSKSFSGWPELIIGVPIGIPPKSPPTPLLWWRSMWRLGGAWR
jgi:hypothetical protein